MSAPPILPASHLRELEGALGGPALAVTGHRIGITGLATATVTGPTRRLFVKWPTNERGEGALQREVHNLLAWDGPWPHASPTLRHIGEDPLLLAFDHVEGTTSQLWSKRTTDAAFATLAELSKLAPTGPLSRSNILDEKRYLKATATLSGSPSLLADVRTFFAEMFDATEVFCHGDAHTENWVIRPDGEPCLVDFEHSGGGPTGWDHAFLAARLRGDIEARAQWATRGSDPRRARIMVAAVVAKCLARYQVNPADPLASSTDDVMALWRKLGRASGPFQA